MSTNEGVAAFDHIKRWRPPGIQFMDKAGIFHHRFAKACTGHAAAGEERLNCGAELLVGQHGRAVYRRKTTDASSKILRLVSAETYSALHADFSIIFAMDDPVRQIIRERMAELGMKMSTLSRLIGKNHSYIQQFMEYNKPQILSEMSRIRIARALGINEADLRPKYDIDTTADEGNSEVANINDSDRNDIPIIVPGAGPRIGIPEGSIAEIDVRAGLGGAGIAQEGIALDSHGRPVAGEVVRAIWVVPDSYMRNELQARPELADIVEVLGDSMAPTLTSGDRVIIDKAHRRLSPDGLYALHDGDGVIVKRLERIGGSNPEQVRIISDNPHHSSQVRLAEELVLIGRVIGRIQRI